VLTPGWRGCPEWEFVPLPYLAANVKDQSDENNIENKSTNTTSHFDASLFRKSIENKHFTDFNTIAYFLKIVSVSLIRALEAVILIMRIAQ
jgi:hypothetical protein